MAGVSSIYDVCGRVPGPCLHRPPLVHSRTAFTLTAHERRARQVCDLLDRLSAKQKIYRLSSPAHPPHFTAIRDVPCECHKELAACFTSPTVYHHNAGHVVPADPAGVTAILNFISTFLCAPVSKSGGENDTENVVSVAGNANTASQRACEQKEQKHHKQQTNAAAPSSSDPHSAATAPASACQTESTAGNTLATPVCSTVHVSGDIVMTLTPGRVGPAKADVLTAAQVASCIRSAAAAGGGRGRTLVRGNLQELSLYNRYRAVWNGMHDRHPAVIVVASEVSAMASHRGLEFGARARARTRTGVRGRVS